MRIAIDGLGMQSGSKDRGIGRYLRHFIEAVADAGQEVVVTTSAALPEPDISHANVAFHAVPAEYTQGVAAIVAGRAPAGGAVDLFVVGSPFETHAKFTIPDPATAKVGLAAIAYDVIPALFPADYLDGDPYADLWRENYARFVRYPRLFSISDSTRRDLISCGVDAANVRTIGAAAAPDFFSPGPADRLPAAVAANSKAFVLYLGQQEPRKNLGSLVRTFSLLSPVLRSRHRLVVVCPANKQQQVELRNRFRQIAGPTAELVHLTRVDDDELLSLYRGCAAFVFPSKYEGFGLPLLEAMQCGAAAICGDNSSQVEVAGDAAVLVDVDRPAAVSAALTKVLHDAEFAADLKARAIVQASSFTWERVADSFLCDVTGKTPARRVVGPFVEWDHRPSGRFADAYENRCSVGRNRACARHVAICVLARNLGAKFATARAGIEAIGGLFASWDLFAYENDSADGTAGELQAWRDELGSPVRWLATETLGRRRWPQARDMARAAAMAEARNRYHEAVRAADVADTRSGAKRYDHVVVMDTDLAGWSPDGVCSTLGMDHWDAVGSNGLHRLRGRWTQYDAWAWRDLGHPGPHAHEEINPRVYDRGHPPIPLDSCFGGMAVYGLDAFLASSYAGGDCEHVPFHKGMAAAGYPRVFMNPGMIAVYR